MSRDLAHPVGESGSISSKMELIGVCVDDQMVDDFIGPVELEIVGPDRRVEMIGRIDSFDQCGRFFFGRLVRPTKLYGATGDLDMILSFLDRKGNERRLRTVVKSDDLEDHRINFARHPKSRKMFTRLNRLYPEGLMIQCQGAFEYSDGEYRLSPYLLGPAYIEG